MRKFSLLFCICLLFAGCSREESVITEAPETIAVMATVPENTVPPETIPPETTAETLPPDPIRDMLDQMSLEERVGQLFLARCEDATAIQDISRYHLGGFILFGKDFKNQTKTSMQEKITRYQAAAEIPLLIAVDEEGGTVTRVSSNPAFRDRKFSSPRNLYNGGGMEWVLYEEDEKCRLLRDLGINVNVGPVCDITTDPNAFMFDRSLGQDMKVTSEFVMQMVQLMDNYHVGNVLKHFPGYGNNTDTHTGIAVDSRTEEELAGNDLLPFLAGIQAGCHAILVSHTIVECLDATLPASLSPAVHQYLRQDMAFEGVIVTDDLVMQAITDLYGAGEAAVMAVLAGNDLLCSSEYSVQYEAVLAAVLDGRIDIDTLNNAVRNVLEWKIDLGLI